MCPSHCASFEQLEFRVRPTVKSTRTWLPQRSFGWKNLENLDQRYLHTRNLVPNDSLDPVLAQRIVEFNPESKIRHAQLEDTFRRRRLALPQFRTLVLSVGGTVRPQDL